MALFGKKNDRVLDLTERYKKQLDMETRQEPAVQEAQQETQSSQGFNFLGSMASGAQPAGDVEEPISGSVEERKRKLTKRLVDMTNQLETLSNQIYHLQQRIEVLERKSGVRIE